MYRTAVISECGRYRYRLSRWWIPGPRVCFLMLNPSTADDVVDDATIRKCLGLAARWGYTGIDVINLFALRSRHPKELLRTADPVGPDNAKWQEVVTNDAALVIAAWGCEPLVERIDPSGKLRERTLERTTRHHHLGLNCLGMSPKGTPYHPLRLPYSTPRQVFHFTPNNLTLSQALCSS